MTAEVSKIGTVNCLFRRGSELIGTNTDGEAALQSFHEAFGMNGIEKYYLGMVVPESRLNIFRQCSENNYSYKKT